MRFIENMNYQFKNNGYIDSSKRTSDLKVLEITNHFQIQAVVLILIGGGIELSNNKIAITVVAKW